MARKGKNIYQRKDGRWEGRYVKGRIDGKIQYGYVFGKSYEEVERKLTEVTNAVASAINSDILFSDAASDWLNHNKPQLKPASVARYTNILNSYLLPLFGETAIREIGKNDVQDFGNELLVSGGVHADGLAPKTVNSILSVMKNVFDYASSEKGSMWQISRTSP